MIIWYETSPVRRHSIIFLSAPFFLFIEIDIKLEHIEIIHFAASRKCAAILQEHSCLLNREFLIIHY